MDFNNSWTWWAARKIGSTLTWRFDYKKFNPGAITRDMDYVRMAMKSKLIFCVSLLMLVQAAASAKTITVPSRTYKTIQAGIYAASNGDVVEVEQGVYTGYGNRNLDFGGKKITVRSAHFNPDDPCWAYVYATIIDCCGVGTLNSSAASDGANANRAFYFHTNETSDSKVMGFTIRNGYARGPKGADADTTDVAYTSVWHGIPYLGGTAPWQTYPSWQEATSSDPALDPCTLPPVALDGNAATGNGYGGAIECNNASPTISYCVIENCTATGALGGAGAAGLSGKWSYYTWADFNWVPGLGYQQLLDTATLKSSDNGQAGGVGGMGSGNGYGGAIAMRGICSPAIDNCRFMSNSAQGGQGGAGGRGGNCTLSGGAYTGGLEGPGGNAGDSNGDGIGGAIYAESGCEPVFTNCLFEDNAAKTGPRGEAGGRGYGNVNVTNDVRVSAGHSSFVYTSSSPAIAGGAVYFENEVTTSFTDCNFINNKAYVAFFADPLTTTVEDYYYYYTTYYFVYNAYNPYAGYPYYPSGAVEDIMGYTVGGAMYFSNGCWGTINTCDFIKNGGDALYFEQNCNDFYINNDSAVNAGKPGRKNLFQGNTAPDDTIMGWYIVPSSGSGGAIYVNPSCFIDISNSIFNKNTAKINGGAIENQSDLTISDCVFSDNTALGSGDFTGFGGAVDVYSGDDLTIGATNCSFISNKSVRGGALSTEIFDGSFNNCIFTGNEAQIGGALDFSLGESTVTIADCNFNSNVATSGNGGGIYCSYTSADIQNCEFFDNSAEGTFAYGGGIDIDGDGGSGHTIKNSLFVGNASSYNGGAVACEGDSVVPRIQSCSFSQNTASQSGGSIYADWSAEPQIKDCIVQKSNNYAIYKDNSGGSTSYCLFYNNPDGNYYSAGVTVIPGSSGNLVGNPLFVTGTLGDYYLSQTTAGQAADSCAINNGSVLASALGLNTKTTATNDAYDSGKVDIGYHYSRAADVTTVTLTTSVVGGTGTISDGNTYRIGQVVTVTATPQTGWVIKQWTGTDNDSEVTVTQTVVMNSDRAVTVEFKLPTYLRVPQQYASIADAMADANDGDIIVVDSGTYPSSQIQFTKSVELRSAQPENQDYVTQTILDFSSHADNGIFFPQGANSGCVLNGFTIINSNWLGDDGWATDGVGEDGANGRSVEGGSIWIGPGAGPVIKNCIIRDNSIRAGNGSNGAGADAYHNAGRGGWGGWARGGAVYCSANSYPQLINCQILNNQVVGGNGGNGGAEFSNGGSANFGGNWSRAQWYSYDPRDLTYEWVEGDLYQRWTELAPHITLGVRPEWSYGWYDDYGNFTYGYIGDYRWYSGYGGGVYINTGSKVTFTNCVISNNSAGGGLSGLGGTAGGDGPLRPEPYPSIFEIPAYGGGVYIAATSNVVFNGCIISNNVASDPSSNYRIDSYLGHGGGICAEDTAKVTFVDCNFTSNHASLGGGLFSSKASLVLNDCNVVSNRAYQGGGMFGQNGSISINKSIFNSNTAPDDANDPNVLGQGGALNFLSARANIFDTNIIGNSAEEIGGGLYLSGLNSTVMRNCIVRDNNAIQMGGAVAAMDSARLKVANCTIVNNTANLGGGLFGDEGGYITIINSIIWGNFGSTGTQLALSMGTLQPSEANVSYSDIQGGQAGVYKGNSCLLNWGTGNINSDPCFISGYYLSQIAAGQTYTSPCVDTGSADVNSTDINLVGYTTSTDSNADVGIVDMGYHYSVLTPLQCHLTIIAEDGLTSADVTPSDGNYVWFSKVALHVSATIPDGCQIVWTGTDNDNIGDGNNSVHMTGDKTVTVGFGKNTCTLTVQVVGGSGGTVTPTGGTYLRGTTVTLTATPNSGYRISWQNTDDDTSYAKTNEVTMNKDKTVTITFSVPQTLTVPSTKYPTIQAGIEAAQPGDIVSVASGIYHGSQIVLNKEITLASTNPDDPCVVAATVIDSTGYDTGLALYFTAGATANTVVDGFTIRSGTYGIVAAQNATVAGQNGPDGGSIRGGAVYVNTGASPTLRNCVIRDTNITGGNAGSGGNADTTVVAGRGGWGGWARGGGIYVAPFANPTLINCTVTNCTVTGGNGGNGGNSSGSVVSAADYRDANYGGLWSNDFSFPWWELSPSGGGHYVGDYRFYSGYGGGVFCDANSAATFIDCNITNNTARGGMSGTGGTRAQGVFIPDPVTAYRIPSYGGGVYCGENANINFVNCTISGNVTPKPDTTFHTDPYLGHGGGIAFENTANIRFENCAITGNTSAVGGGMLWTGGAPEVLDCNIINNIAYVGGGIYATKSSGQIQGCTLRGNFAGISPNDVDVIAGQGGGIFGSSIDTNIIDCILTNNTSSTSGAGIHIYGPATAETIIRNCLLTNNQSGRDGGGISVNWGAVAVVENCTLYDNQVTGLYGVSGETGFGGGLYCSYDAIAEVNNSIFWDNNSVFGYEIFIGPDTNHEPTCGSVIVSFSDIKGGRADVNTGNSCSLTWGLGNINVNPQFVDASGDDFHLKNTAAGQKVNSPCIDAGGNPAQLHGLFKYSTSTLGTPDTGVVDIGYHYLIADYCRRWDLNIDNKVDFKDLAIFALSWVGEVGNGTSGYDVTDLKDFTYCWLEELPMDIKAPTPNPMTWLIAPRALAGSSVEMEATHAKDDSGTVYYQFEDVNGTPTAWQVDPCYTVTGLSASGEYCFRVRAKDKYNNITSWSEYNDVTGIGCVTNVGDTNAPTPAPTMIVSLAPTGYRDDNDSSEQFLWSSSELDWWHKIVVDVSGITDDTTATDDLEVRFVCSNSRFSSENVIPAKYRPIRIGTPLAIGGRIEDGVGVKEGSYRLTWNGTDLIVYDVFVNSYGGAVGVELKWQVCVYDASGNSACSTKYTIPQ